MAKKNILLGVIFYFLSTVCFGQTPTRTDLYLSSKQQIPVHDFNLLISEFEYIEPVKDDYVIVQRKPQGVSVLNRNGEVVTKLGNQGHGPFEWQMPSYIQNINEQIIIWDAGSLKFIVFDKTYEPVRELMGIRTAINGFSFKNENQVAVYNDKRLQNEFIHIYERDESGQFDLKESMGHLTDEGRTLFMIAMSGGILWNGDDLVWVNPAVQTLFVYNTKNDQQRSILIDEELFSTEPWNEPDQVSPAILEKFEEYIFSNSRIVSLQKLENHILVEMEHFPNGEPVMTYQIFDLDYNFVGHIEAGEGDWVNYIRGADGNKLFYWGEDYTETGEMNSIKVREVVFD